MALTLAAALAAPTQLDSAIRLTITGTVPDAIVAGYQFRLGNEVLQLRYFGKEQETVLGGAATQTVDDRNTWYAERGVDGTAIVIHAQSTAIVGLADALTVGADEDAPDPFAETSGGGVTVHADLTGRDAASQHPQSAITGLSAALAAKPTITVTDAITIGAATTDTDETVLSSSFLPEHVGSIVSGPGIVPGSVIVSVVDGVSAELSAAATATAASVGLAIMEPDPGAVGAGNLWVRRWVSVDPNLTGGPPFPVYVRNADDNDWLETGTAHFDASGLLRSVVQAADGGVSIFTYDEFGTRRVEMTALNAGFDIWMNDADGNQRTMLNVNGGNTPAVEALIRDAAGAYLSAFTLTGTSFIVDAAGGPVFRTSAAGAGFNGAAASIPELPATPTAQDIADALVALGLVTQAAP